MTHVFEEQLTAEDDFRHRLEDGVAVMSYMFSGEKKGCEMKVEGVEKDRHFKGGS